jgi:hypothetical protein
MASNAVERWMHLAQRISRARYDRSNFYQVIEFPAVPPERLPGTESGSPLLSGRTVPTLSLGGRWNGTISKDRHNG